MYGTSSRLQGLKTAIGILGVVAVIAGCALIVTTWVDPVAADRIALAAAGVVCMLAGLMLMVGVNVIIKVESNTYRLHSQVLDLQESFDRHGELLAKIVENTAISDVAKSLTNRHREWEAMQAAIRADVRAERWEAALHLIDGIEQRFGSSEQTANLRREVVDQRTDVMRRRFEQAARSIEELINQCAWERAEHEIDRLHHALPDEPRVEMLRQRLGEHRAARKAALLAQWRDAVSREDVDESIRILGDLDAYLTRDEAKALEDPARNIFRAKLMQLGMQFRFAVKEQRWRDALEIGVQIVEEFPNSRMSKEVTEAMEGLRRRAGLHSDVEVTAGTNPTASNP